MKWMVVIWLLSAGVGLSYSVVKERNRQVEFLRQMEHSLRQLAYFMHQWRMPVEEAVRHVAKEENGILFAFYSEMLHALADRRVEDFGRLWQEKSICLLQKEKFPDEIKKLWSDSFLHIPMEPEALNRRLILRTEEINSHLADMQEKYKGEQKLVLTLGFFTSAFLCLILW